MSIASYLLFAILGFLSMVLVNLAESLLLPGTMSALPLWVIIYSLWLWLIGLGLYHWFHEKAMLVSMALTMYTTKTRC